jgi:uncharacterized protein YaiL (DUF2058 family)
MAATELTPEEIKKQKRCAYERTWKQANPEKARASVDKYQSGNRDKLRERGRLAMAAWRKANPEKNAEKQKEWRDANRESAIARSRIYYAANKEKMEVQRVERRNAGIYYYNEPANRIQHILTGAKRRAKANGIEFDLGLYVKLKATPAEQCACCAATLEYKFKMHDGRGFVLNRSPSLDRFDNTKGYTVENVRVICLRCNILKRDATVEELEAIVAYMRRS